jgi:hypothetical protein
MKCLVLIFGLTFGLLANDTAEAEVRGAMNTFAKAMVDGDKAGLEKVLHPNVTYSHSTGLLENKQDVIDVVAVKKSTDYYSLTFGPDTKIKITDKVAVAIGGVTVKNSVDGKPEQKVELNVLHVFLKGKNGWQMIGRQAAKVPVP